MLMKRTRTFLLLATAASALALAGGVAAAQSAPSAHSAQAVKIRLGSTGKLGKFLVSGGGLTLYLFEKDTRGKSTCSSTCAQNWPPLTGTPSAGSGVSASKLGTVKRSDGKTQVTYNGHPLYMFAGDRAAGQTTGQGLKAFGASWYVVAPTGNKIDKS
jgi:predicted lipoprotein with Yx(FWY)xxD motif